MTAHHAWCRCRAHTSNFPTQFPPHLPSPQKWRPLCVCLCEFVCVCAQWHTVLSLLCFPSQCSPSELWCSLTDVGAKLFEFGTTSPMHLSRSWMVCSIAPQFETWSCHLCRWLDSNTAKHVFHIGETEPRRSISVFWGNHGRWFQQRVQGAVSLQTWSITASSSSLKSPRFDTARNVLSLFVI